MYRNLLKSVVVFGLVVFLLIPTCTQAFPMISLTLAKSITFATFTVNIVGIAGPASYSPDTITIHSGDTIYWKNTDFIGHSATCGTGTPCGQWDSTVISGLSSPITNFSVGTTPYYCEVHGTAMYGAVITLPHTTNATNWEYFTKNNKSDKQQAAPTKEEKFGIVFLTANSRLFQDKQNIKGDLR